MGAARTSRASSEAREEAAAAAVACGTSSTGGSPGTPTDDEVTTSSSEVSPFKRRASVEEEVTGRKGSSPPPLVRTPSNVPSISEDEWGGGEDDEGIEEIDGGGVPLSPMAEEDEGSWGDEGAPDVMMTFDGENWVPRRSSFDASSI